MQFFSKVLKLIFGRMFIVGALIAVQAAVLIFLVLRLSQYFVYVYAFFTVLSVIMVFWVVGKNVNPAVKLTWVIVIMAVPVFGGLFYVIFGRSRLAKKYRLRMETVKKSIEPYYPENIDVLRELIGVDKVAASQCMYMRNTIGMPVYKNTICEYLGLGEIKFERLKRELEKAQKYIFLEYFIVERGEMWDAILEILERKVKQGIDVRVMFDDIGCVQTLPYKYNLTLEEKGIKVVVFNPFKPSLSSWLQNRDHRKIAVIDGNVGFTGGINLADEYINVVERFGHWKDCAIVMEGEAVYSLTLMFLELWNYYAPTTEDYSKYKPKSYLPQGFSSDGYVMPYGDTPLDEEYVGESIYLNLINNATDYIYINSPYFVVDNELITAICLAAKRGVDVRVVTPHIADKWYVHLMTRSYYTQLIMAGVSVYEYTPGFIHSKTFVVDDKFATIGTINMDYRSLYHHFECGVWLYKNSAVYQLRDDFMHMLKVCEQISYEKSKKITFFRRILRAMLRLAAPLM